MPGEQEITTYPVLLLSSAYFQVPTIIIEYDPEKMTN